MLKSQSKVKELTRELRNKTEESDEYKRKMESLKNERRRGEKTITEVINSTTRPNRKILVFRVTQPYLNLLVKPRIFFRLLRKKNIVLCILKGLSKCIKLYFFHDYKIRKKKCVPTLPKIFRPLSRNIWPYHINPKY